MEIVIGNQVDRLWGRDFYILTTSLNRVIRLLGDVDRLRSLAPAGVLTIDDKGG